MSIQYIDAPPILLHYFFFLTFCYLYIIICIFTHNNIRTKLEHSLKPKEESGGMYFLQPMYDP